MRGTPWRYIRRERCGGLIPTYARNTHRRANRQRKTGAHPHVCGEHGSEIIGKVSSWGSSPRMRGTHLTILPCSCVRGLIPTYAGNTLCRLPLPRYSRAHPHVCGEHITTDESTLSQAGSSPRMRGTHFSYFLSLWCFGLIPTYAGNTKTPLSQDRDSRAHPHVCGEHLENV